MERAGKLNFFGMVREGAKASRFTLDIRAATYIAIGFLLGRAVPAAGFSPFVLAYLGAVRGEEKDAGKRVAFAAASLMLGTASLLDINLAFKQLLGILLFAAGYLVIRTITEKPPTVIGGAALAMTANLMSGLFFVIAQGFMLLPFGLLMLETVAVFILCLVFRIGAAAVTGQNVTIEQYVSLFITVAFCALGLSGIEAVGIRAPNIYAAVLLALTADIGGVAAGAACAIALGVINGFNGSNFLEVIGVYAFCGLAAGTLSRFYKPGILLGLLLSNSLLTVFLRSDANVFSIYEIVLAGAIYILIPRSFIQKLTKRIKETESNAKIRRVCKQLGNRFDIIAAALDKLSLSIATARTPNETNTVSAAVIFDSVAERICKNCASYENCWQNETNDTYDMLFKLTPLLRKNGRVDAANVPAAFKSKCERHSAFIKELNRLYQRYKLDALWQRKISESRHLACQQLDGVSGVLKSISGEVKAETGLEADDTAAPAYDITCGAALRNKQGEECCGDCYTYSPIGRNSFLAAISDGMGAGREASAQSKLSLSFLEDFLAAGFNELTALKLINSVLLLRSNEDTYATLDVTLVNMENGKTRFAKVGANTTFIKRGNEVEQITCNSLPAGILKKIEPQLVDTNLKEGDCVIMMSDGVHSPVEDWACDYISKMKETSPQLMAENLLRESLRRRSEIPADDMTALCCKLIKR